MKVTSRFTLAVLALTSLGLVSGHVAPGAPLWQKPLVAPHGGLDIGVAPGPNGTLWVENASGAGTLTNSDALGNAVVGVPVRHLAQCGGNASGLASTPKGELWATCYAPSSLQQLTNVTHVNAVPGGTPWGVAVAPSGTLWVADLSGNVSTYGPTGHRLGTPITGLSSTDHPLAIDGAGRLWVVEDGGVVQYSAAGTPTGVTIGATNDVGAIAIDPTGTVWTISTGGDVLRGFSPRGLPVGEPLINPAPSTDRVYFATFDSKGNFWFSTGAAVQEVTSVSRAAGTAGSRPSTPTKVVAHQYANTATIDFAAGRVGSLPTHFVVTAYRDGRSVGVVCNLTSSRRCLVASLTPNRSYRFVVTAVNVLGRASSPQSSPVRYAPPRGVRPTAPENLRIVTGTTREVSLHWTAAKGATTSDVVAYACNGGTKRFITVTGTSCVLPRSVIVRHGGFVVLSVVAVDAAHRHSAPALLDIKVS